MNFFLAVFILVTVAIGILFVTVVIGLPEEKKVYHRNIFTDNIVNEINYSFCENEVQKPYYHYGFEHYTYQVSHLYYLKNMGNNEIENLDIFPLGMVVFYAKYHKKINKWVVLMQSESVDDSASMDIANIHMFTFENKNAITKSKFTNYSISKNMGINCEVDPVEEKVLYYDKDHIPQKIDI